MWIGKIIGGILGLMMGGVIPLAIGLLIGHYFDKGYALNRGFSGFNPFFHVSEAQRTFFDAAFQVMGHLAKADGRVNEYEIRSVQDIMVRLRLNETQRARARESFTQGKASDFDLEATLERLKKAINSQPLLLTMFVRLQLQTAMADGRISPNEQRILDRICEQLGVNLNEQAGFGGSSQHRAPGQPPSKNEVSRAYEILNASPQTSDAELKKQYRRLMSQNHPDKLVAKGLPEEMIKLATEKTQEIQKAYDLLEKHRKK